MKLASTPGDVRTLDETPQSGVSVQALDLLPLHESPEANSHQEPPNFSLVQGGPLFQLCRRAHLSGDALQSWHRPVLVITLLAWLPLLFLSVLDRQVLGGTIKISFLHDIEAHVRFLVALPVLIIAELVVQNRTSSLIRRFVERQIVIPEDFPRFKAAVDSALRVRDSIAAELTLVVLVYTVGLWIWRSEVALGERTWYAAPAANQLHLTLAGFWYASVSIPIFQFILLRWYMRLGIWFRLLWQISRLHLHLSAAHPDLAGGIGFLGKSSYAFAPVLFAQGSLLAGLIASRVLYEGKDLMSFKMEAAGFVGFFVLMILGPLVMFTPLLDRAKRKSSGQYGLLANRYIFHFEAKWMRTGRAEPSELPDSEDIQAMSSLENINSNVGKMRLIPFGTRDITHLAAATAAPLLPLSLTIFSVPQLGRFLVKILFH
jgi:hypothetical protein